MTETGWIAVLNTTRSKLTQPVWFLFVSQIMFAFFSCGWKIH